MTKPSRRAVMAMMAAAPTVLPAPAPATAQVPAPAPQARKLKIGLASRHLQFLSVDDAIKAAKDMGFEAIEWAVRAGAHILPENATRDLPAAVEKSRAAGLTVEMITTMIQDAKTPHAEDMLRAAQSAGVRYYRGSGYYRYDYAQPPLPQIEALTVRMASLEPLNQRYGTIFCYHTHSGRSVIGGNVWDIWTAMRDLDPSIGLNFDSGHTTIRTGSGWTDAARIAGSRVQALALKDFRWVSNAQGRWVSEFCPMGEGQVDFDTYFRFFRDMGFVGPVNIHYEHNDLLGEDFGRWQPAMPQTRIMELMVKDLVFVRDKMRAADLV